MTAEIAAIAAPKFRIGQHVAYFSRDLPGHPRQFQGVGKIVDVGTEQGAIVYDIHVTENAAGRTVDWNRWGYESQFEPLARDMEPGQ